MFKYSSEIKAAMINSVVELEYAFRIEFQARSWRRNSSFQGLCKERKPQTMKTIYANLWRRKKYCNSTQWCSRNQHSKTKRSCLPWIRCHRVSEQTTEDQVSMNGDAFCNYKRGIAQWKRGEPYNHPRINKPW